MENKGHIFHRRCTALRVTFVGMLLGCGWAPKEIAYKFGLSTNWVQALATKAKRKYGGHKALVSLAVRCGCAALLTGCMSVSHTTPDVAPPTKAVFDPATQAHALVRVKPPNNTTTTATLGWNPYNNTEANALLLTWEGGSTILPRTNTTYHVSNLKVNTLYHFNLCGTNTVYTNPNLTGQCDPLSWTATLWTTSTTAPVP